MSRFLTSSNQLVFKRSQNEFSHLTLRNAEKILNYQVGKLLWQYEQIILKIANSYHISFTDKVQSAALLANILFQLLSY